MELYEGDVELFGELAASPDAQPGDTQVTLRVLTQACDHERCLAPREQVLVVPVRIAPGG
jgi:hypothetical protein